jgi:hypothetical protein
MRNDLKQIHELCSDIGLASTVRSPEELAIELADGVVLRFRSADKEKGCFVQFEGTPWHNHGNFIFVDSHGYETDMNWWNRGELVDRWLDHQDYVGPFRFMQEGDEIRIWRISR